MAEDLASVNGLWADTPERRVARVLTHQWNLLGHLALVCAVVVAALLIDAAVAYAALLVSAPRAVEIAELLASVLLLAALRPLPAALLPTVTVDQFLADLDTARADADRLATRPP